MGKTFNSEGIGDIEDVVKDAKKRRRWIEKHPAVVKYKALGKIISSGNAVIKILKQRGLK